MDCYFKVYICFSWKGVQQVFLGGSWTNGDSISERTHKYEEERLACLASGAFLLLSTLAIIMPVMTIKDGSLCFLYEDSSPLPIDEPYTTLMMVHGTGFHLGKWLC
jgi:hypothetical protein